MNRDIKTCVHPDGYFLAMCHLPSYQVLNNRVNDQILELGTTNDGEPVKNLPNFPKGDLFIERAQPIYEIPNAFPFWGTTYILGDIAKRNAKKEVPISFAPPGETSFDEWEDFFDLDVKKLPRPIVLAIAKTCKDARILERLLPLCADLIKDGMGRPVGIRYEKDGEGNKRPRILDHDLYETLGNNPFLPDNLKRLLLLNPGVQGLSPIVGEYIDKKRCHIWEYLRANSYIPWGHYAANMAQDSVRYSVESLDQSDVRGLRHLYYQRIYMTLLVALGLDNGKRGLLEEGELEEIRLKILAGLKRKEVKDSFLFSATLWGWNYGYDFSPSGFRLHASHQQIHQQFALIPEKVGAINDGQSLPTYAIGDSIHSFIKQYENAYNTPFFKALIKAIDNNQRLDKRKDMDRELVIFRDENVMLFAPKAQRSQGELQLICLKEVGNILEADTSTRKSIDLGILTAVKVLSGLGARMITSIEISKRFFHETDQRLMYCFLPKHPQSPGAFSEQQGRWITGHFPEDFARACRGLI